MQRSEIPFLIIAGAQKAGTTSLFSYLSGHPQVAPCRVKEPCYFLPRDYPVPSRTRYGRDSLSEYLALYSPRAATCLHMDGTATYLHAPQMTQTMAAVLPHARIIISLREPVSRLTSWYKMAIMLGVIPENLSFDDYVRLQWDDPTPVEQRAHHLRAVEQSRYAHYLRNYIDVFGRDRVHLLWFDQLKNDPRRAAKEIARFAGINPAYFDTYEFKPQFESLAVTHRRALNAYEKAKSSLRRLVQPAAPLSAALGRLRRQVEPYIYGAVTAPASRVEPGAEVRRRLDEFYRPDTEALERLLGRPAPWSSRKPA